MVLAKNGSLLQMKMIFPFWCLMLMILLDPAFFVMSANQQEGYLSSNRYGTDDVFGFKYAIIETIKAGKTVDKLFIQKGLHNDAFAELWKLVRLRRVNYKHVPLEKINRLTNRKPDKGFFHPPNIIFCKFWLICQLKLFF